MTSRALEAVDAYQRAHRWLGFPLAVIYKFFDDQGTYLAALIAYVIGPLREDARERHKSAGGLPGGCRLGVRFALTLGEALFSGSKSRSA